MIGSIPRIAFLMLLQLSAISAFQCTQHKQRILYKLHASADDNAFDPLLSPHAYPTGTGTGEGDNEKKNDNEEMSSPLKMKSVKDDFQGASKQDYGVEKSTFTRKWSAVSATSNSNTVTTGTVGLDNDNDHENENDNGAQIMRQEITTETTTTRVDIEEVELFNPLISPHAYAKGTKNGPIRPQQSQSSMKKDTVGVLLIDHGSKRSTSNQRLEKVRDIYQDRSPDHYSVKAAHMEIAEPSIQQQLREFCKEGVRTVVCHPYFLSPGRHVLEDIPELIEEAIGVMREEGVEGLEVVTTDPVGSNLDLMVGLIGTMVDDALGVVDEVEFETGFVEKEEKSLGGFFGEVQRMLDEQL
jgi:sirohydrochlorin ferrochelatase